MRISQQFAERLAELLAERAVQVERAMLEERRKALSTVVLALIHEDGAERYEALPECWKRRDTYAILHFRDGERYCQMRLDFGTEVVLPAGYYNGIALTITDHDLMDEIQAIDRSSHNIHRRAYELRQELRRNILAARTVKKLYELWPEATDQIATVAAAFDVPATEVPLDAIFRRHGAPMLAAPVIVEVTA